MEESLYFNASNSRFTPTDRASVRPEVHDLCHGHCTPWRCRGASLWQSPRDSRGPSRLFCLTTHISSTGPREPRYAYARWARGHMSVWQSSPKEKMPLSLLPLQEFAGLLSSAALFHLLTLLCQLSLIPGL